VTGDLVVVAALRRAMPVLPDWHIVKLDERHHWRDDLRAKTRAIYGVYALDKSSRTFLCEATPSYALWWLAYEAEPVEGMPDDERESLYETVECDTRPDQMVDYMHVRDVEAICREHPDRIRQVTPDDAGDDDQAMVDEIAEGWNTGAWRF
jgi:hypothetical protein